VSSPQLPEAARAGQLLEYEPRYAPQGGRAVLFRPTADQRIDGVTTELDGWNVEADRFRTAAIAARHGEQPSSALVAAAEEAQDGLMILLEDMDRALEALPPGHKDFAALLRTQMTAIAIMESIRSSLDVLSRFAPTADTTPMLIERVRKIAAE
jgi:hypothetical protein